MAPKALDERTDDLVQTLIMPGFGHPLQLAQKHQNTQLLGLQARNHVGGDDAWLAHAFPLASRVPGLGPAI